MLPWNNADSQTAVTFMAKLKFLLQPTQDRTHAAEVRMALGIENPTLVLISVAFVRQAGVAAISSALQAVAAKTRCFIGIRNDITSIQAVEGLLATGVQVFAVDTASRHKLYHPKLYLAQSAVAARAVIGSANLTFNGLHNNIEASSVVSLELADHEDASFVADTVAAFDNLVLKHPEHVFRIRTIEEAGRLLNQGRLVDEKLIAAPSLASRARADSSPDLLAPIQMSTIASPAVRARQGVRSGENPAKSLSTATEHGDLIWRSKPLKKSNLSLPTDGNDKKRIGLGQGALKNEDWQTYYRRQAFSHLHWTREQSEKNTEIARAMFELVISGVSLGEFRLVLAHDTREVSKTKAQANQTTSIRWGDAAEHVKKPNLLGRTLSLYRRGVRAPRFLIEID
jgi:HKD family nuclease